MNRRIKLVIMFLVACRYVAFGAEKPLNVLFIAVDDLRPQAGVFGQENMHTPNLDRLGREGMAFRRAYCSVAVCGASRASLLSGVRATASRFRSFDTRKDVDVPNVPSLPMWFKNHGYVTVSNGKIYHNLDDDLTAWSETPVWPKPHNSGLGYQGYLNPESIRIALENPRQESYPEFFIGPAYECGVGGDESYTDGAMTAKSIADLRRLSAGDKPFFLAVGFRAPHLPFVAPKKYWDLYDDAAINLADNQFMPEDAPREAWHNSAELRFQYAGIPREGLLPKPLQRKLVHGYYACVSYVDALVGKLLDELNRLGIADRTVVILWGDHGWHLGEHGLWCKHCNFDRVLNAPLFVRAPGKKGGTTSAITEFVDIYPSLCELCHLPRPEHLDGTSFVPVLENPSVKVKDAAYSRYGFGDSVITRKFLYTEFSNPAGKVVSRMLYDLEADPKENVNIGALEENESLLEEMRHLLRLVRQTRTQ